MSRLLFVVLSEKGHVHPFIGPAQELVRRRHQVAFYSPFDLREPLARAGFGLFFGGTKGAASPPAENRGHAFAELVRDKKRLRAWIAAMLVDSVPDEVLHLSAAVKDFRPHAVIADPMAYAAPIVCRRQGLPWAGVSTSLNAVVPDDWTSELIATTRALPRAALFASHGVPEARFRVSDCLSPHVNVAFTTRELLGDAPGDVLLAGASLPIGERGDVADAVGLDLDPEKPLVFMSLGSQIHHQPRMFEVVAEATRGMPWEVVMAAGDLANELRLGSHVHVLGYAPQLALLRRARMMITHGGANSVMEALAQGVPLLVSPICNDQPHNARFVAASGAGFCCDLDTASPAEVRGLLARLCEDGPPRARAARIARSYADAGGRVAVADAVQELLRMIIPVTVPAKNEERALGACLDALLDAAEEGRAAGLFFDLLVVLDDCTDRSVEVARSRGVRALNSSGGKVEAQRRGLRPGPFSISVDADVLLTRPTLRALAQGMLDRPEVMVAFPPKVPLPPRRASPLARALHLYNRERGYSSQRTWFNGKCFAIRRWDLPTPAEVAARAARLTPDPFLDLFAGLRADDVYLSRRIVAEHGPGAIAETAEGCVRFRAPETMRGMYRYYRRLRMELARVSALFPELEDTQVRFGSRHPDLLSAAPAGEQLAYAGLEAAFALCSVIYRLERAYYRRVARGPGPAWPPIEETKCSLGIVTPE